jgi:hypothetical protein
MNEKGPRDAALFVAAGVFTKELTPEATPSEVQS